MRLYLEDLFVGRRFRGGPVDVTVEDIEGFAAKFDPQPFHLDEEAARDSLFEGLVASGWHTAALTMRMLTQSIPVVGGLIGASCRIDWPRPVRPGDRLSVESEILDSVPSRTQPDRGFVKMRVVTSNQNGEAVQIMSARVLAFARPASA